MTRTHPVFGTVDTGRALNAKKCPNCGSSQYRETTSLEQCTSCGLRCDYWGGGSNEVYQRMMDRQEFEEDQAREAADRKWREENGY